MNIQCITSGRNGNDEKVVLWRTGEYEYELDIGSGIHKKNVKFYGTEFNEAFEQFMSSIRNKRSV
jgi:hypothetical protein